MSALRWDRNAWHRKLKRSRAVAAQDATLVDLAPSVEMLPFACPACRRVHEIVERGGAWVVSGGHVDGAGWLCKECLDR